MISNILPVMDEGRIPWRTERVTLAKQQPYTDPEPPLTNNECYNYALLGDDSCQTLPPFNVWYVQDLVWNQPEYTTEVEQEENLDGVVVVFSKKKSVRISFNCLVDDQLLSDLHGLALLDSVKLATVDSDGNPVMQWNIYDIAIEAQDFFDYMLAVVSFRVENTTSFITACCGGLYDGAPFEPCPEALPPTAESIAPMAVESNWVLSTVYLEPELAPDGRYAVYKNGVRLQHLPLVDLDTLGNQTNWSYDAGTNTIYVPVNDALYPGDTLFIEDATAAVIPL